MQASRLILPAARTILSDMSKEFEFFIVEALPKVVAWAQERKQAGAIIVGNSDQLLEYLQEHTEPNDDISTWISGAGLRACVTWSVYSLLTPAILSKELPKRTVSCVTVDLTRCLAREEGLIEISPEERGILLRASLWEAGNDPRLTLLTAPPARECYNAGNL